MGEPLSEQQTFFSGKNPIVSICFVLLGISAMLYWELLIYSINSVHKVLYPKFSGSLINVLVAIFMTSSLLTTALLLKINVIKFHLFMGTGITMVIAGLSVAATCTWFQNLAGIIILNVNAFFGGILTAIFETCLFAFASSSNLNYVDMVCLGLGLSALVSFFSWMVISKYFFDRSPKGIIKALWVFYSCGSVIIMLSIIFFSAVIRRCTTSQNECNHSNILGPVTKKEEILHNSDFPADEVNEAQCNLEKPRILPSEYIQLDPGVTKFDPLLNTYSEEVRDAVNKRFSNRTEKGECAEKRVTGNSEGVNNRCWKDALHDSAEQLINVSVTLSLTMFIFPGIAPFSLGHSLEITDILTGLFQLFDFIGRCLPVLSHRVSIIKIQEKRVIVYVLLRFILLVIFILRDRTNWLTYTPLDFTNTIILALSNGWICSTASVYATDSVQNNKQENHTAAAIYVLFVLTGITVGFWSIFVYRKIFPYMVPSA